MKRTPTCVILPERLEKLVAYDCEERGVTKTQVIIDALTVYFEKGVAVRGIMYILDGGGNAEET